MTNPDKAFSIRKVLPKYEGPLMKVVRENPDGLNEYVDVYSDEEKGGVSENSRVDPTTWGDNLKEFSKDRDVYEGGFYDQSGNANHPSTVKPDYIDELMSEYVCLSNKFNALSIEEKHVFIERLRSAGLLKPLVHIDITDFKCPPPKGY